MKTGKSIWQTVIIALSENHQWMLKAVAESMMENKILRLHSLHLPPYEIQVNYKGKGSNFIMEKLSRYHLLWVELHFFSPNLYVAVVISNTSESHLTWK